tara:strand:+ start:1318 stop:1938 length:621 start_codon:yes stop_codon:yes gene_type:complete
MEYIIYKTTNLINYKTYIGCHQTTDLNDGYIGSGKLLKRAIVKYGIANFTCEILHQCATKEEMFAKEKDIVNETFVKNTMTYNLKVGGSGGNPGIIGAFTGHTHSKQAKEKISKASTAQIHTSETRRKIAENNWAVHDPEAQRKHARSAGSYIKSTEHKRKLSEANKGVAHERTICPHCGKEGGSRAMARWHFDNCAKGLRRLTSI